MKEKPNTWRQCGKKKRYRDESEARFAIRKCKEHRDQFLDFYYCVYCKGYHITHQEYTPEQLSNIKKHS